MSIASSIISAIEKATLRTAPLPEFRPGDSIKVWAKIREGEKTRLQAFEGVCIRRTRKGSRSTFTVRKISYGVGVERVFADNSPNIDRIDVMQRGRVRQSRLFYLRDLSGKAARIKERAADHRPVAAVEEAAAPDVEGAEPAAAAEGGDVKLKGRGARKRKKEAKAGAR
jgi:large subunit ribosomal protein L19